MNGKKARAQRAQAVPPARSRGATGSWWTSWRGAAVALAIGAVISASFVVPGAIDDKSLSAESAGHAHSSVAGGSGDGLEAGSAVPEFAELDVENGQAITSESVRAKKTLLFFSEGVMCQACFQQIKGLEDMQAQLDKRGIQLVSITPDSPADLTQAIDQYGIETPMIADSDRDMSAAFDTLGLGMHSDTPGHAFALIEKGAVLWYHDYWLPPDRTMYVDPAKVLADLPAA